MFAYNSNLKMSDFVFFLQVSCEVLNEWCHEMGENCGDSIVTFYATLNLFLLNNQIGEKFKLYAVSFLLIPFFSIVLLVCGKCRNYVYIEFSN